MSVPAPTHSPFCYHRAVTDVDALTAVAETASRAPGLDLLLLFGSRARGDAEARSDWDFGYLASSEFDPDGLLASLVTILRTDKLDLADLSRAGAQFRFRAAGDGRPLYERTPRAFERFWLDAVSYWCEMGPIIRSGYEQMLADLDRRR